MKSKPAIVTGVIKNIVIEKNFGYIEYEGAEYFFHQADFSGSFPELVLDYLNKVDWPIKVDFRIVETEKGPRAEHVRRVQSPNAAIQASER